ncbi:oligosaccharyl transferase, STT3 subunit [Thermococcus sp. M36]|nr:oligosaccharyl transferase, STT3 subunit [Thermococcus sp. M36]
MFERFSRWKERVLEPRFALVLTAAVAGLIRLLPLRFKYLLGYDPYFHLAYIRYALEKGAWVNFFPYATGSWGYIISSFHPKGLWMTPAYVYKLLSPFGVSLYNAFRVTPVIFGVLTVVFIYLVALRLYGREEAFLSAFLLSVLFGHVFRSMAGYYRGDNYMLFSYSLALSGIALALSLRGPGWRYRRWAFYLALPPALAFSAASWQAYYPIFAIVLANALLLAVGGFVLRRNRYLADAAVIVILSLLGALLASWVGGHLGYGMVGPDRWVGKKLAEEFGLQAGFMKDVFLTAYVKYAVPAALAVILVLFLLSRLSLSRKQRGLVVLIGAVLLLWVFLRYLGTLDSVLETLFREAPIAETQRTSFNDWWTAYGIVGLVFPLFFLRFFRGTKPADFLLLGTAVVLLPMALIWTRFLFIASPAVALMAGIGLTSLWKLSGGLRGRLPPGKVRKAASIAVILLVAGVPAVAAYQGVKTTLSVHPLANEHWEEALAYLGEHSNPNDVVLTWWDEGHWVTYFSGRAPVAQGSPSGWVAKYYLGLAKDNGLMNLGVDYVIVSYDLLVKFGAVVDTAGGPSGYSLAVLPLVQTYGNMLVFSSGGYSVMAAPGRDSWDVKVNIGGAFLLPEGAFVEHGGSVKRVELSSRPTSNVYVYMNLDYGYAVLVNEKTLNTPLGRLMLTGDYPEGYTLLYSDGGLVKIFRFSHPNVVVTAGNGSVILKFENATGTGIGIFGYLDNGTLVFKKWYGVKGKDEFPLPDDLNGSVVIRYTYVQKKTVLDRGVFRIDDVLHGTGG